MEDLRQKEPFFGKWYIDECLSSSSDGDIYRIKAQEHGIILYSLLTYISIAPTDSELSTLRSMGKDDAEIRHIYEEKAIAICADRTRNYDDMYYSMKNDRIGFDLFFRKDEGKNIPMTEEDLAQFVSTEPQKEQVETKANKSGNGYLLMIVVVLVVLIVGTVFGISYLAEMKSDAPSANVGLRGDRNLFSANTKDETVEPYVDYSAGLDRKTIASVEKNTKLDPTPKPTQKVTKKSVKWSSWSDVYPIPADGTEKKYDFEREERTLYNYREIQQGTATTQNIINPNNEWHYSHYDSEKEVYVFWRWGSLQEKWTLERPQEREGREIVSKKQYRYRFIPK